MNIFKTKLIVGLISISSMIFVSETAISSDTARIPFLYHEPPKELSVHFTFSHVQAKNAPLVTGIFAQAKAYTKGILGITTHSASTFGQGLELDKTSTDTTHGSTQAAPDPYGNYTIDIVCLGTGAFANQMTSIRKFLNVTKKEGILEREVSIQIACPVNEAKTTLLVPQVEAKLLAS